jgi:hypothetical protein
VRQTLHIARGTRRNRRLKLGNISGSLLEVEVHEFPYLLFVLTGHFAQPFQVYRRECRIGCSRELLSVGLRYRRWPPVF